MLLPNGRQTGLFGGGGGAGGVRHLMHQEARRPGETNSIVPRTTDQFISRSILQQILNVK